MKTCNIEIQPAVILIIFAGSLQAYQQFVSIGERSQIDFVFAQPLNAPIPRVDWIFFPPSKRNEMQLDLSSSIFVNTNRTRFKSYLSQMTCPDDITQGPNTTCWLAQLVNTNVNIGDDGTFVAHVKESTTGINARDCSPCYRDVRIHVLSDRDEFIEGVDGLEEGALFEEEEEEDPMAYFYGPPLVIDFNMNSSVCAGRAFEFLCSADPPNAAINLTLLRLDSSSRFTNLRSNGQQFLPLDFENAGVRLITSTYDENIAKPEIKHKIDAAGLNDTGGYLCMALLSDSSWTRWTYMYLQVEDCSALAHGASTADKSLGERAAEALSTPMAITFVTLLLLMLTVTVAAIGFLCRRRSLPMLFFGPMKWGKAAANKVVRETNLLYPWASSIHHNCTHEGNKEAMCGGTNDGSAGGRNLQVPAVIIQVNSLTKSPSSDSNRVYNSGENNTTEDGVCRNVLATKPPKAYKIPNDPAWEVPRSCICIGSQIGAGNFGVVFAGVVTEPVKNLPGLKRRDPATLPNGAELELTVAVKTLHDDFNEQALADLVREMEILKQFDPHPHVIQLYGACTQHGRLQVLVELAPYGNLRDFLMLRRPCLGTKITDQPMPQLSTRHLVSFGLQVAKGMDYLTRLSIVHRDLAARNILVGDGFVAKIADFGLTRSACDYYRKFSDGRLPIKWMAPESIFDRRYTAKSDVWSFGILLWEIFSFGATPYPTLSSEALLKALQLGFRNEQPLASPTSVYNLMLACWSLEPTVRPDFSYLVSALQHVYDEIITNDTTNAASSATSAISTSASSSRSSSPTRSTAYMTLQKAADIYQDNDHNRDEQHLNYQSVLSPRQWPTSSSTPEALRPRDIESGQYLQGVHKAFATACNYLVTPQSADQLENTGQ